VARAAAIGQTIAPWPISACSFPRARALEKRAALKPGPAACWFNLARALVPGETNSALVHTVSAADLAGGISAVVNLGGVTFVNADLTLVFWRQPRVLDLAEFGDARGRSGHGRRGNLSDLDGAFGACEQTLLFERRERPVRDGG
jgi:hypothetical protein